MNNRIYNKTWNESNFTVCTYEIKSELVTVILKYECKAYIFLFYYICSEYRWQHVQLRKDTPSDFKDVPKTVWSAQIYSLELLLLR